MKHRTRGEPAKEITRREALGVLGAIGLSTWLGCEGCGSGSASGDPASTPAPGGSPTPTPSPTPADLSCVVTPAETEGPFFVDEGLERSDLTSDTTDAAVLDGLPLRLEFGVYQVAGAACSPLAGAQVDVWHSDTEGTYSDVQNAVGETFLRGYQITDEAGAVVFTTIYPGWYPGRTVHIHFKVRFFSEAGDTTFEFTSQLFFDDAITETVVAEAPYSTRGAPDTTNETDSIYANNGADLLFDVESASDGSGYVARYTIGLEMS